MVRLPGPEVLTVAFFRHRAARGEGERGDYWGARGRAKQGGGRHSRPRSCPPAPARPSVALPPAPSAPTAAAGSAWQGRVLSAGHLVSCRARFQTRRQALTVAVLPAHGVHGWPPPGGAAIPPVAPGLRPPAGTVSYSPAEAALVSL